MSSTILSTKILSLPQKSLLLNAGLQLVEYNAIEIEYLAFELPSETYESIVFTSQNGVAAFLKQFKAIEIKEKHLFCVGSKTKSLLEKNGLKIKEIAQNSADLGKLLIKTHQKSSFLLISGNRNLPDMSNMFKKYNIRYKIVKAYTTSLNFKRFGRTFEGVLFFSPSGVQSFMHENELKGSAFCIGPTTAEEVKNHSDDIITANKPTVENVIVQAIKYFNSRANENNKSQVIL